MTAFWHTAFIGRPLRCYRTFADCLLADKPRHAALADLPCGVRAAPYRTPYIYSTSAVDIFTNVGFAVNTPGKTLARSLTPAAGRDNALRTVLTNNVLWKNDRNRYRLRSVLPIMSYLVI